MSKYVHVFLLVGPVGSVGSYPMIGLNVHIFDISTLNEKAETEEKECI